MSSQHRLNRIMGHISTGTVGHASSTSSSVAGTSAPPTFETVLVEMRGRVGIVTLNRPKQLNVLNDQLVADIGRAITWLHLAEQNCGAIIITGAGKAFAAGADIREMINSDYYKASTQDKIAPWEVISRAKLPLIAAVNGIAFGGGCEIAMMCDIMIAADVAKFGQPEIKIGTIPGAGGTQRLIRAIGKSKAMEMCLTGKTISAQEAERDGLVAAVVPLDQLMARAMQSAEAIASLSRPIVIMCKDAVNASFETTLAQGAATERRIFHSTFALEDRAEGMKAFAEKRAPVWRHK